MEITFRPARPTDVNSLYRMICELENEELDREAFVQIFLTNLGNKKIYYVIAEAQGAPVGMASCYLHLLLHHVALVAEIQEMYVDITLRSQGIGRQLIKNIRHFAKLQGATQLEVTSNLTRLDTHRFYLREGFQQTHTKLVMKF